MLPCLQDSRVTVAPSVRGPTVPSPPELAPALAPAPVMAGGQDPMQFGQVRAELRVAR